MYCLFALNKFYFFVFVSASFQMAKKELPLVIRFQHAIICHQRIKIGKAVEVWSRPKVGVNGQIIVIFAKIENFRDIIYLFSSPLVDLSYWFFPRSLVAYLLGKNSGHLGPSRFWENKSPNLGKAISAYKSTFLHFVLAV